MALQNTCESSEILDVMYVLKVTTVVAVFMHILIYQIFTGCTVCLCHYARWCEYSEQKMVKASVFVEVYTF